MKHLLKKAILVFGILAIIYACQKDDATIQEEEQLIESIKAFNLSAENIPQHILNYVGKKTNQTFRVNIKKKQIKLSNTPINAQLRQTPLGIVQTNKVVQVYNEKNIKYTFKVSDPTNAESVINLIVVDMGEEIIEYFIQYIFDPNIAKPVTEDGIIDMTRFTGAMLFYDSEGTNIGNYVFNEGDLLTAIGETDPCDYLDTGEDDGNPSGSGQSSNSDPSNGNSGGGYENVNEFENVDSDCGFIWNYGPCGCLNGPLDGHSKVEADGCCSGSPLIVSNSCTGDSWSSRLADGTTEESSPCEGTVGVLVFEVYPNLDNGCQGNKIINFIVNTDSPLVNFIKDTFMGTDQFNLSYENLDFPDDVDALANTIFPSGLNFNSDSAVNILYDNAYLNEATDLSIVMTTAHEYIHVYLAYLYSEGQLLEEYPNYTNLNNAFISFQNISNQTTGELLGEEMHNIYDDFLDWITQSVFEYATDNNIEGATEEYCTKLVIGSHQYTDAFQDLDETIQNQYSIISTNEQNGTEQAKGTSCE